MHASARPTCAHLLLYRRPHVNEKGGAKERKERKERKRFHPLLLKQKGSPQGSAYESLSSSGLRILSARFEPEKLLSPSRTSESKRTLRSPQKSWDPEWRHTQAREKPNEMASTSFIAPGRAAHRIAGQHSSRNGKGRGDGEEPDDGEYGGSATQKVVGFEPPLWLQRQQWIISKLREYGAKTVSGT